MFLGFIPLRFVPSVERINVAKGDDATPMHETKRVKVSNAVNKATLLNEAVNDDVDTEAKNSESSSTVLRVMRGR